MLLGTIQLKTSIFKPGNRKRIATYELIYKGVNENSGQYNDSINYYSRQIEQILTSLNNPKGAK